MEITNRLVKYITSIEYEDLPPAVVNIAKSTILDTTGAMLAGTSALLGKKISSVAEKCAGKGESSIIGTHDRVPAAHAALANATIARARELDDALEMLPFHASAIIIPCSLAVAQACGGISGRDFITAVTLGIEIAGRLGLASKKAGRNQAGGAKSMWGTFGAAAASAKTARFNSEQTLNVLGLAYRLGGGGESNPAASQDLLDETVWLGCGIDGMNGVLSGLLAGNGFKASESPIETYYLRYENNEFDEEILVNGLPKGFMIEKTSFKAWPTCRYTHASIEATLKMVIENDIKDDDIEEVNVQLNQMAFDRTCQPLEIKRAPSTVIDALFSVPFAIGSAVVNRKVWIGDFEEKSIKNGRILAISKKVNPRANPNIRHPLGRPPAIVEIKTKNGKIYQRKVDYIKGNPEHNPLSREERVQKFRDCVSWANRPLKVNQVDRIIHFVDKLEEAKDATEIFQLCDD